jgi:hypothetical protein
MPTTLEPLVGRPCVTRRARVLRAAVGFPPAPPSELRLRADTETIG